MNFRDVYGIRHENCKIVSVKSEYKRIVIFSDVYGHNFVGIKENPEPTRYSSANSHWKYAKATDAPRNYYFND